MIEAKIICDGCDITKRYNIPLKSESGDVLPGGWIRLLYTPGDGLHLLCSDCVGKVKLFIENRKDV